MKTSAFLPAVSLAAILAIMSLPVFAQTTANIVPPPPFIEVNGNAQVEVVPDQATVRIGVIRQSGTAKEAQDEANKVGQAILKSIGALGIPAQRIQTSRLTVTPVYAQQRQGSNESPRITGFSASNSVTVTLDNLTQIGPVVDAGLDNGANQLEGVQFQLKNDGPAKEQALRLAVTEAKGKAVAMAAALSITLGPVLEVSESGVNIVPSGDRNVLKALVASSSVPAPVSPGQLEISASVILKFAIVSKN